MPPVVVLGAGYAGAHAARKARAAGVDVVVVDPDGCHGLAPRFAGIAAGRMPAHDAAVPLEDLLDVEVVRDRAVGLDTAAGTIALASGGQLTYGTLVVTVGAAPSAPPVPGILEHARPLASVDDALALRDEVAAAPGNLVVIGGGATGVQLASEVARHWRGGHVTVVEREASLLPGEPRSLGRAARRLLDAVDVEVLAGRSVTAVDAAGVVLDDGTRRSGTVAWAGGWQATGSRLLPDAPTRGGRLVVGLDLAVDGEPEVFAAGDTAAHTDPLGRALPMSAQVAAKAGAVAGHNAAARLLGRPTRPAVLVELGRVLEFGGGHAGIGQVGVARVGPVRLARRPLDRLVPVLHLGIDLRHLWQVGGTAAVLRHAPGRTRGAAVRRALRPTPRRAPEHAVGRSIA